MRKLQTAPLSTWMARMVPGSVPASTISLSEMQKAILVVLLELKDRCSTRRAGRHMNNPAVLCEVIRTLHGCEPEHVGSVPIVEKFHGKTVWKGTVEVFDLKSHPKAQQCFAWSVTQNDGTPRHFAVLGVPPFTSPQKA